MKLIPLFFLLLLSSIIKSQEFSFPMYFEDAVGNKDTIIIGYDPMATDSLDVSFGEVNIIDLPYKPDFDVRVSDEWEHRVWGNDATFHTKKQITKQRCANYSPPIFIDILCKNWPVTASWDSTIFADACRIESTFTGIPPSYWWDVTGPSNLYVTQFRRCSQVAFSNNVDEWPFFNPHLSFSHYVTGELDTISLFWVVLGTDAIFTGVHTDEPSLSDEISFFPNPSKGIYKVAMDKSLVKEILIYDQAGKLVYSISYSNQIDILSLPAGCYFYMLRSKNGVYSGKLLKQ